MARKTKQQQIDELRAQLKETTKELAEFRGRLEAAKVMGTNAYRFFGGCQTILDEELYCKVLALALLADLNIFIPKDDEDTKTVDWKIEWIPGTTLSGSSGSATFNLKNLKVG